jgi:hypothetical protein
MRRPAVVVWLLAVVGAGLFSTARAGEDALPLKKLTDLKAATVFLKVEDGREGGSGSGFVIKTEGQTAYLVTNHHVIDLSDGKPRFPARPVTITAVFGSGTKNERSARAEVLAGDARRDLAVLRVQGVRDLPPPLEYDHEPELVETMPVYILGFPLGEMLATGKNNPAITVNKGSVSSIRLNDRGEVATVQIDGDITPGNSGGPVVDARGRLIGVAAATIRGRNIGFAVPGTELNKRLKGRLLEYHFTTRPVADKQLEVLIELAVFDPFDRIKGVSFYHVAGDGGGAKKLAKVAGARKVELRRQQGRITGTFTLAGEGATAPVAFQVVYVNGDGKTFLSNPRVRRFQAGAPPPVVAGPPAAPPVAPPPPVVNKPLDKEGIAQAIKDLETDDINRRSMAADRLAKTPPGEQRAEVLKALEPRLTDKHLFVRMNSAKAYIAWAGKDGTATYYKLLKHEDIFTRQLMIEPLAKFEGVKAAEALAERLTDPHCRHKASKALQEIGPGVEKAVQPYLEKGDWVTRVEACNILRKIGTADSIDALKRASNDMLPGVKPSAEAALREINNRVPGGAK